MIKKLNLTNKFYNDALNILWKCQNNAIEKYGIKFTSHMFYSIIAQDLTYINDINKVIGQYQIHIDYYPRVLDNDTWIIDSIFLPVYVTQLV